MLSSEGVSEVIIDSAYKQKLTGINWIAGQESWDKTTSVSKENNAARGMFQIGPTAKLLPFKEHLRNITRGPIKNVWLCQLLSSGHPKNTSNSTSKSHCDCTSGLPSNARKEFVDDIINKLVSMAESEACVIDAAYAIAFAYNAKANCKSECPEFIEYLQQVSFTSKTGHKVSFDDQKNLKEKEFHFYNYQNKVPITILFGYFSECNKKALDFLSVVIEKKIYVTIELQLSIDPMMLQIVKKTIRIFDYNWNRMHADTVSTSNFHGEQVSLLDC